MEKQMQHLNLNGVAARTGSALLLFSFTIALAALELWEGRYEVGTE